jgi:hypothetical protein
MAKPLGPKSILIRDAIKKNSDLRNTEIAQLINGSEERKKDKIAVKPGDIAAQRQAMKKAGITSSGAAKRPAGKKGRGGHRKVATPQAAAPQAAAQSSPVDLIDRTLDLAAHAGGVAALKRLVDRLAAMREW